MISIQNSKNKVYLYSIAALLFYFFQVANAQNSAIGKTTQEPYSRLEKKTYTYTPVDVDFWDKSQDLQNLKKYIEMISLGLGSVEEFGRDSEEGLEGLLIAAIGLRESGLSYASTLFLIEIIKKRLNSELAQKALFELELITKNSFYDHTQIRDDLLNSNEFQSLHPEIQSFVSFHVGLNDLSSGYRVWASQELKKINPESFWGQKIHYQKALNEVSQGKLSEAETRFTQITLMPNGYTQLQKRSQLQIARISFEKKDFKKAANIYRTLKDFNIREKGRILMERAWSLYYLKEYSEALGILKALKSPYFEASSTPERFILEMIIFKQLCYYEAVSETAREYYDFYSPAILAIKKRKNLEKIPQVARMALMNYQIQEEANFINQLRDELENLIDKKINNYKILKDLPRLYREKDKEIQQRLNYKMTSFFPRIMDEILDSEEQIKFLDYTSKIDALRIVRRGEDRKYESEKVNHVQFDRIFWPVDSEYWLDEYDDYKLHIKSQCDKSLPSSSEDSDLLKKFGEEFK